MDLSLKGEKATVFVGNFVFVLKNVKESFICEGKKK